MIDPVYFDAPSSGDEISTLYYTTMRLATIRKGIQLRQKSVFFLCKYVIFVRADVNRNLLSGEQILFFYTFQ